MRSQDVVLTEVAGYIDIVPNIPTVGHIGQIRACVHLSFLSVYRLNLAQVINEIYARFPESNIYFSRISIAA